MNKMQSAGLIVAAIFIVIAILLVAGCAGADTIGQHKEYVIHKNVDGQTIPCVVVRTDHGAGISCNWGVGNGNN